MKFVKPFLQSFLESSRFLLLKNNATKAIPGNTPSSPILEITSDNTTLMVYIDRYQLETINFGDVQKTSGP